MTQIHLQTRLGRRNGKHSLFSLSTPREIQKAIYTNNAIESLNMVIRKAIRNRRIFPCDSSAFKVIFLAVQTASKKWTMPMGNWGLALSHFAIAYGDRLPPH